MTSKGQITIPEQIRRAAGILPGTEVDVVKDQTGVHILKQNGKKRGGTSRERRLADVVGRLRGSATIRMSTEEIMALTRGK